MKIVSIVGARPQFIKAVSVSKELRKNHQEVLVHTGQHYDVELSRIFFDELGIPKPDYNLGIGSDTHARQTARMMIAIEDTLLAEKPGLVLVYGDTNSTLAGALAAVKLHIPVAHVEAGPRMFDKNIPEEVNRILTDHVSSFLFAPTQTAVDNLRREGITEGVHLIGDVMLDSFLHFSKIAEKKSKILERLQLSKGEYMLATVHRARNTDSKENLKNIIEAFRSTRDEIVFPVHPRTRKMLNQFGLLPHPPTSRKLDSPNKLNEPYERNKLNEHLLVIRPVGYLDSIVLTRNAKKVLTDSGGLQKEAYFSAVPCITLDEATCWPETVEDGWNTLVGSDKGKIIQAVKHFQPQAGQRDVFGDVKAATRIVDTLARSG
jgi:UDP-N-acetylglucosamine 2-epimerase